MYLTRTAGIETIQNGTRDIIENQMYLTRTAGIETTAKNTSMAGRITCILPALRELKQRVQVVFVPQFQMYLTRTAGIETSSWISF